MNIRCYILLFSFVALTLYSVCQGTANGEISGYFFTDKARSPGEIKNPLPGALIALYGADDNLLVDHTYSIDNGRFILRAPHSKGRFYIVATKDKFSKKTEIFEYDPQTSSKNVMVRYEKSRSAFSQAVGYTRSKLDHVITTLIGLFIGLGIKLVGDRQKAKKGLERYILMTSASVCRILRDRDQLEEVIKGSPSDRRIYGSYQSIIDRMKEHIEDLEKQLSPDIYVENVAASRSGNRKGRDEVHNEFMNVIGKIKNFTNQSADLVLTATQESREKYMEPFRELKELRIIPD